MGLTKATLERVERLKDVAGKLAEDTEDKIRRIAGNLFFSSRFLEVEVTGESVYT